MTLGEPPRRHVRQGRHVARDRAFTQRVTRPVGLRWRPWRSWRLGGTSIAGYRIIERWHWPRCCDRFMIFDRSPLLRGSAPAALRACPRCLCRSSVSLRNRGRMGFAHYIRPPPLGGSPIAARRGPGLSCSVYPTSGCELEAGGPKDAGVTAEASVTSWVKLLISATRLTAKPPASSLQPSAPSRFTAARAGQPLSTEINVPGGRPCCVMGKAT